MKKSTLVLCACAMLCACSNKDNKKETTKALETKAVATTSETKAETKETQTVKSTEATKATEKSSKTSKNLYEEFLGGSGKLYFDNTVFTSSENFVAGKGYTISEVKENIAKEFMADASKVVVQYIEADFGGDGKKEMRISFSNIFDDEPMGAVIMGVKDIDGKLECCIIGENIYRTYFEINQNGFVSTGGSDGAALHISTTYIVDKDGVAHHICTQEFESGNADLILHTEYKAFFDALYEAGFKDEDAILCMVKTVINEGSEKEENYISLMAYPHVDFTQTIEESKIYADDSVYMLAINKSKLDVVKPSEVDELIRKRESSLGVNEGTRNGAEAEWKTLND